MFCFIFKSVNAFHLVLYYFFLMVCIIYSYKNIQFHTLFPFEIFTKTLFTWKKGLFSKENWIYSIEKHSFLWKSFKLSSYLSINSWKPFILSYIEVKEKSVVPHFNNTNIIFDDYELSLHMRTQKQNINNQYYVCNVLFPSVYLPL